MLPDRHRLLHGMCAFAVTVGVGLLPTHADEPSTVVAMKADLDVLWHRLSDANAPQAYRAIWEFVGRGDAAVNFLDRQLSPVPLDRNEVRRLIRDLDDPRFSVRHKAYRKLARIGLAAETELRQALPSANSPEVRHRLGRLLELCKANPVHSFHTRRTIRGIRILREIGTNEAQVVLRRLASGAAGALETRHAVAALDRIRQDNRNEARLANGWSVGRNDWPQLGGPTGRNNVAGSKAIPTDWNPNTGHNVKWTARLGSQTYGSPVIANGKVYVGTSNAGYVERFPRSVDIGCLLCFDEETGELLWQHSSRKLTTGRVHDWPHQGICSSPYVDGDRLWFVSSRGEVICLDTEGFLDGENDGPFRSEEVEARDEADVVWSFDMMQKLGVRQHNMANCSVTCAGDLLFVNTSNGVDESHLTVPAPEAPSFVAFDRETGELLWSDNSPGKNILHGQWSSPTFAVIDGRPQVLFAGGDGWLYSFAPKGDGHGRARLLWKFDCNPKHSKWILGGRGTRNNIIGLPVVYGGRVYVAVGQDPEHGEGAGHLWCLRADGSGDVSSELAVDERGAFLPHKRRQVVVPQLGHRAVANPASAVVWHYTGTDLNGDGTLDFGETMHRACGTVTIENDLLFIADSSGLVHCIDAIKGKVCWTYDMFAASWGSPLIVEDKVYVADEDGDVAIFPLTADPRAALKEVAGDLLPAFGEINVGNSIRTTPAAANNVLYIASRDTLFAIAQTKTAAQPTTKRPEVKQ